MTERRSESELRPMLFSEAIDGFILFAKAGKYSPSNIPTMTTYLRYMCKWFGDPELDAITLQDWQRYFVHLRTDYKPRRIASKKDAPLTESSIDNHWKIIRGFYNWAEETQLLSIKRPDLKLPRQKYESPQIVPFTRDEVLRLIESTQFARVEKQNGQKYKIKRPNADRDKVIILVLLDTGIRLGELARLQIGDINLENGEVQIRPYRSGKKSKARTVYLGARTRQAVWRYVTKKQFNKDEFSSLIDLKRDSIRLEVRRIGKNARVPNTHPHRFRHTFAITYLRNHGDVFTLQRLLGHSTLDMVQKYLAIIKEDIAKAHQSASPVDNWKL